MTTLVGIKCEKGKEGVILASDLSRTHESWEVNRDVAYRQQTKSEGQKIYVDNKRELALCMSGVLDQLYIDFLSKIIEGKIDVEKAAGNKFFPELKDLNEKRWDGKIPSENYLNGLLLSTRFKGQPQLYGCWPLGLIESTPRASIGSGSDYVKSYINKQGKLIPRGVSLEDGVDLVVSGLEEASQDIYTGGLDIVIVTADGIKEYGTKIKSALDSAKKQVINNIKRELQ